MRSAAAWFTHLLRLVPAGTQLTAAERDALERHARGRRTLVEIGVYHGASTARLARVMAPGATLTAIDPYPAGRLGVSFERMVALREVARAPSAGVVRWLRATSHDAAAQFSGLADFVFVDGDHSWDGIARDWDDWSSRVAPRGVIVLHDSRSVPTRPDLDSVRFTTDVVARDARFREVESVASLSVWERLPG